METYEDDDGFGFSASGSIPVQDDAASDDVADDYWKSYIASKYGDRYITDPSKLTMDNYQSEEAYLDTFRINDADIVEDVTGGGVADGGLISQEFLDTAVKGSPGNSRLLVSEMKSR